MTSISTVKSNSCLIRSPEDFSETSILTSSRADDISQLEIDVN